MSALFKENALARRNSNMHIVHFTAVLLESVNETDINFASVVSNLTQTIGKDRVLMLLAEVKRRKEQNPTIPNTVGGLLLRMAKQHMTQDERRKVFKRHRTIRLEPATVATFSRVNNNAKRERERERESPYRDYVSEHWPDAVYCSNVRIYSKMVNRFSGEG